MRLTTSSCRRAICGAVVVLAATMTAGTASAHGTSQTPSQTVVSAAIGSMTCPVAGDSVFSDSWGNARSGGRRHQGVDMVAPRGTPVVAALAGFAEFKNTSAGGKSVWLTTTNGDKFFYAHLDAWEGVSRDVAQGDVIGYVGSTGNAGGPHLHFEVRPGGRAVNPYPPTAAACAPRTDSLRSGIEVSAG